MTVKFPLSPGSHLLKSVKQKGHVWLVYVPRTHEQSWVLSGKLSDTLDISCMTPWVPKSSQTHILPKKRRTHQVYILNLLKIRFSNQAMLSVSVCLPMGLPLRVCPCSAFYPAPLPPLSKFFQPCINQLHFMRHVWIFELLSYSFESGLTSVPSCVPLYLDLPTHPVHANTTAQESGLHHCCRSEGVKVPPASGNAPQPHGLFPFSVTTPKLFSLFANDLFLVYWDRGSSNPGWPWPCPVGEAGLGFRILLPPPPWCRNYKNVPSWSSRILKRISRKMSGDSPQAVWKVKFVGLGVNLFSNVLDIFKTLNAGETLGSHLPRTRCWELLLTL